MRWIIASVPFAVLVGLATVVLGTVDANGPATAGREPPRTIAALTRFAVILLPGTALRGRYRSAPPTRRRRFPALSSGSAPQAPRPVSLSTLCQLSCSQEQCRRRLRRSLTDAPRASRPEPGSAGRGPPCGGEVSGTTRPARRAPA